MTTFSIPPLIIAAYALLLGVFIFFNRPSSSINRSFAFLCFSTFWWQFTWAVLFSTNNKTLYPLLVNTGYTGIIFIPIAFFNFLSIFLKSNKDKIISNFAYAIGLFFVLLIWTTKLFINGYYMYFWGAYPKAGVLHPLYLLLLFYLNIRAIFLLLSCIKDESIPLLTRNQAKYLLWPLLIYFFAASDFVVNYGYEFYPVGFIFTSAALAIIPYAILRHRLMDIEIIIKKGFIYSVLMAAIIGIYSFLIFIGQSLFQAAFSVNHWIPTVATAFIIAVGYKPLETYLTNFTNQYFFRKKYDYQATLKQSSEAMNLLTDIDRLVKLTTRIVARRMGLIETSTLVYDGQNHKYIVKAAEGKSRDLLGMTFSDNHELFKQLFTNKQILIKDEVIHTLDSKLLMPEERKRLITIRKEMEKLHAQICVPSITRGKYMGNRLVAVFCMGEKKSGDMYTNEDIQLLTTLSNQAAVAVENAIMYSDLMKQFQELKTTKDQLVQSEKLAALGTMAAGIAHEIKNPLTSLQLFAQMMSERFDDHEFRAKFTQVVPPEIERLNRIVNDLVSFSKPAKLLREPNQINEILDKTIRLSEISFKKLNVKVVKEFTEVPKVLVDPQQIMQIFLNLIMNGAQAMQSGGTLTVKTYYDDLSKKVCVEVKDTGTGISEENMKKLFSPFFTTKEAGTGLGLAITRRIIEEHKGEIKVQSKVGEGTTFKVELPTAV